MSRWDHHLNIKDVFYNEGLSFKQRRDEIVRRIRAARWYRDYDGYFLLSDIVDRLAEAEDADDFDDAWDEFYDFADTERVWVATQ